MISLMKKFSSQLKGSRSLNALDLVKSRNRCCFPKGVKLVKLSELDHELYQLAESLGVKLATLA